MELAQVRGAGAGEWGCPTSTGRVHQRREGYQPIDPLPHVRRDPAVGSMEP